MAAASVRAAEAEAEQLRGEVAKLTHSLATQVTECAQAEARVAQLEAAAAAGEI